MIFHNTWLIVCCLLVVTHAAITPIADVAKSTALKERAEDFQWTNITPSPQLQYQDCFNGFQCARLELPIDYNSTNNTDTVSIAITKLPAKVPVTDPRYGGAIILNPGGPGQSGVQWILLYGQGIQTIFDAAYANNSTTYVSDDPSAKYFDLLGVDPRGVNNSTPFLSCQKYESAGVAWQLEDYGAELGTNDTNLNTEWARAQANNPGCFSGAAVTPNGTRIADFLSSTYVAGDMFEIVERHGEWRSNQSNDSSVQARLAWQKGEEPLLYYGVSYGTVLGQILASMQPHRVSRMLLDGVAYGPDFLNGDYTLASSSADDVMDTFFEYCALAGPQKCAMYAGNSSDDTRQAVSSVLDNLRDNGPLAVPANQLMKTPQLILQSDILWQIDRLVYSPLQTFKTFAQVGALLLRGNGTAFAASKAAALQVPALSPNTPSDIIDPYNPADNHPFYKQGLDISLTYYANDAMRTVNKSDFPSQVWNPLKNATYWLGDVLATNHLPQYLWPAAPPKWRFTNVGISDASLTPNPILFANNLRDPATSIYSARKTQSLFTGSGLVTNDGEGHVTSSAPSMCVVRKFREYFQTGQLPSGLNETCLPYVRPFLGASGPNTAPFDPAGAGVTMGDVALYNASLAY